jgi:hypothetical protein
MDVFKLDIDTTQSVQYVIYVMLHISLNPVTRIKQRETGNYATAKTLISKKIPTFMHCLAPTLFIRAYP